MSHIDFLGHACMRLKATINEASSVHILPSYTKTNFRLN
jgi:hypothetical protein